MIVIVWEFVLPMIGSLVGVVLLVFFQNRLSAKDRPWWGLIPMGILLALCLVTNITVMYLYRGYQTQELTVDMEDGNYARMYVRENAEGEIISYSHMKIYNSQGKQIDMEGIDTWDLSDPWARKQYYLDIFEEMTKGKKLIAGTAQDEEVVTDRSKIIFGDGGSYMVFDTKGMWMLIPYMGAPLLAIYILKRRQVNAARRSAELRRMEIESL